MSPDLSMLEIKNQGSMNLITEPFDCRLLSLQNDWSLVIWNLTLWLGVDSDQIQVLPDGLEKLIEVPSEFTSDWNVVGKSVPDFELFQTDRINFIQNVDTWAVDSVSLNGVNEIIWSSIA